MSTSGDTGDGICILSFDSGGPGTYSQLLILKECMVRLATDLGVSEDDVYPADHFDLMGGVGFGGLVALILGHLRMNVDEVIDTLLDVASAIFPEDSQQTHNLELNTSNLKEAVEGVLQRREVSLETKMNDPNRPSTRCKVVLYAAPSARINHPQAFRTYPSRGSGLNPSIFEAVCATMSTPSQFSPVKIGPRPRQQSFVGGPLGTNNPTRELLKEANSVFGKDKRVAQILSIGSGLSHVLSLESSTKEAGFNRLMNELAADCETVAQELHARLYNVQAYLRLNVDRGMENVVMEDWSELGDIASHTGAYFAVASVSESLDTSLRNLIGRIGTVTLGQLNQSSSIKILAKTAPAVSPHFVPRTKPWTLMVRHLITSPSSHQRIFPITGMGGCGKTQMVSYFLQERPSMYTKVAFIDASSYASIQSDLQAWSQAVGDGHERDTWEDAIRILTSVPLDERWLLVLDNADDPTLNLVPFIPRGPGLTVIVTSRNRDVGNLSTTYHLELGEMEEDEALATLLQAARRELPLSTEEMESARTLVKSLGCLALALVQAGAYCHQLSSHHHGELKPFSFMRYLSLFYSHRAELMKESQPSPLDSYKRGVYTTLDLSYQALSQVHREFLHFISFFHHADIPLEALATAARNHFADIRTFAPRPHSQKEVVSDLSQLPCADGNWSELQVQGTIRTLQAFSLLSVTSTDDSILLQLHPLVQAWSRDMTSSSSLHYRAMSIQSLTSCSGKEMFRLFRYILPHILDILDQVEMGDLHVNDLMAVGIILKDQGYYQKAAEVVEVALEKMASGEQQVTVGAIDVTYWLAQIYYEGGKWNEAEKLQVQVLEERRRLLGADQPDTIQAAGELASTYWKQGRHSEAEELDLEVLDQRRKTLGLEHPDTISAAANLAATYWDQRRYGEAEQLELGVLEQRRRILGLEHPDTISAAANLAATYWDQRRYGEAEQLELGVLEQRRRILGLEHPDTILAAASLASTFWNQGRWGEAEKLELEVLEQLRRVLGMEHPDTIDAAADLASTYSAQGRYNEAENLELEVLEQRRKILGLDHPDTILASTNLAATYQWQSRWDQAVELLAPAVKLGLKVLGQQHSHTQQDIRDLGTVYERLGQTKEAEETRKMLLS